MLLAPTLSSTGASTGPDPLDPFLSFTHGLRRARLALLATFAGLALPLALVPIQGAVIAPGEVAVSSQVKRIAHPRGGVLASLAVANGTRVRKGQVLLRLDGRVSSSDAALAGEGVDQLLARRARLLAERDGLGAIVFPADLLARAPQPAVARALAEERRLFALSRASLAAQNAAFAAQVSQAGTAAASYTAQAHVFRQQAALIAEERAATELLWQKRYTTLQRRNEIARAAIGIGGSVASAQAQAAQLRARVAELREQGLALTRESRRAAGAELTQVESRLAELRHASVVAQDADASNTLRAPSDGVVDKLAFTTPGGVIPAGATILEIVPDHDPLRISARISPADVDQLRPGQPVAVRLSAFNARTTPELAGHVLSIAADRTVDRERGQAFYVVEVALTPAQIARLAPLRLRPGMPAEAFFQTESRTLLGYLTRPLADQMARAFH